MLVEFLQDYRGELTNEQFHVAGEIAEFDAPVAARLVADGRAAYAGHVAGDWDEAEILAAPLTPEELAPGEEGELTNDGGGEALPPITDPAEERQAAPRRRSKKAEG